MKIQEECIYNSNILCDGVAERLYRCWHCSWNPTVQYERRKAKVKHTIALIATEQPKQENEPKRKMYGICRYDWDKAKVLYKQGFTDPTIAEALGASPTAVFQWRKKEGLLPNRKWRRHEADDEGPDIAECPIHHARHIDWEKAKEYYGRGLNDIEISKLLQCAPGTIGRWRNQNGLPVIRPPKRQHKK